MTGECPTCGCTFTWTRRSVPQECCSKSCAARKPRLASEHKTYRSMLYNGRLERVHRVVYIEHHGPIPEGHHVHHIDGDIHNNDPGNLVAVTPREHRGIHMGVLHPVEKVCGACGETYAPTHRNRGRSKFCSNECAVRGHTGEKSHRAVLTASEVIEIRKRAAQGERQAQLGRDFGVRAATIYRIVHRQTWTDLPDEEAA